MTIAFGDLQGCLGPLRALLAQINAGPSEPLWFCGDLVNRGPQSLATLRRLRGLGNRLRSRVVAPDPAALVYPAKTRKGPQTATAAAGVTGGVNRRVRRLLPLASGLFEP